MRRYSTLLVTVVVSFGMVIASACTSDPKPATSNSPTAGGASPTATSPANTSTVASTQGRELTAGVLAALSIIDAAGYHAMDTTMNSGTRKIDPQWLGKVRNGQTAVASVTWPAELSKQAKAFTDAADKLAATIESDNAAAAAPAAKANHDAWHDLTKAGWALLAKNAGIKAAAGHGEATPTATGTAIPAGR